MHLIRRSANSVSWVDEETLAPIGKQDSTGHDMGPITSKSSSPSEDLNSRILRGYFGAKDLGILVHLISSPRPIPRRKKCPRTNEGNPDCQIVLPRTTLSSVGQNRKRERRHVARGNLLEDRKRDSKPYGLAIGAWWRSNPRRSCHLNIKYPQLTPWPH